MARAPRSALRGLDSSNIIQSKRQSRYALRQSTVTQSRLRRTSAPAVISARKRSCTPIKRSKSESKAKSVSPTAGGAGPPSSKGSGDHGNESSSKESKSNSEGSSGSNTKSKPDSRTGSSEPCSLNTLSNNSSVELDPNDPTVWDPEHVYGYTLPAGFGESAEIMQHPQAASPQTPPHLRVSHPPPLGASIVFGEDGTPTVFTLDSNDQMIPFPPAFTQEWVDNWHQGTWDLPWAEEPPLLDFQGSHIRVTHEGWVTLNGGREPVCRVRRINGRHILLPNELQTFNLTNSEDGVLMDTPLSSATFITGSSLSGSNVAVSSVTNSIQSEGAFNVVQLPIESSSEGFGSDEGAQQLVYPTAPMQ